MLHSSVKSMSDKEILDDLQEIGISATITEIKEAALKAGSPFKLADEWAFKHKLRGAVEDFLCETLLELWKRHLSDVRCPEIVRDSIFDIISYHDSIKNHNKDSLIKIYKGIEKFYRRCLKENRDPDVEFYREVNEDGYYDIESFLLRMPFKFAGRGLVDEAIQIGRWFADISIQPENFYRDMGCILAEAGRNEEARIQIEKNLKRFPEDVWVVINAGDALYSLGDKRAEEFFLKGYEMAGDNEYDREGALERLVDFYRWLGMAEKAKTFEEEYSALVSPSPPKPAVRAPKIGRNAPCPCGSGKKYKRCCLGKDTATI